MTVLPCCGFCARSTSEVNVLVMNTERGTAICDGCTASIAGIIADAIPHVARRGKRWQEAAYRLQSETHAIQGQNASSLPVLRAVSVK